MTQLGRGRRDLGWGPRSGGPDSSLNRLEQLLEHRRQRLIRAPRCIKWVWSGVAG